MDGADLGVEDEGFDSRIASDDSLPHQNRISECEGCSEQGLTESVGKISGNIPVESSR